jgi:site-specific DNA recombinase
MTNAKASKPKGDTKLAAVYVRVSTQRQVDEGYSLAQQRQSCERFAESKGWKVLRVFEDAGVSGAKKSRPGLDELRATIEAGQIGVLVSPWIDRLGRSATNSHELFDLFDRAAVELWTPDGTKYDGGSPAGKMLRSVQAAAAEYERDMITERNTAAADAKKQRGAFHGGPVPFGYELGENGGLVVCEAEAKWVRRAFKRYANDGASFYAIGKELADANVKTRRGGRWNGTRIGELIRLPSYVGLLNDGTRAHHEPIIAEDLFRRAQSRAAAMKTLKGNGRGKNSAVFLLSHGLLRCQCGEGTTPTTDPNGRRYYRCRRKNADIPGKCNVPNLPQAQVDEAMLRYVSERVISEGTTAAELEAEHKAAVKDAAKAKADARKQIKVADDREASSELKWIDGKLSDERWTELQARFQAERDQADATIKTAEATEKALAEPDEDAIEAVERLRKDIAAASSDDAALPRYRALIVKLFEHVEVVIGPADAPGDDEYPELSFIYKARKPVKGQRRENRVQLLPVLRTELAILYGGDPIKWVGGRSLIDGNACA